MCNLKLCDLCGDMTEEEHLKSLKSALDFSEQLLWLSQSYRSLSNGEIQPHSDKVKHVEILARAIIKRLIDEWV